MVGGDGLEPPKTEVGRFTVSCNSRYANRPKSVPSFRLSLIATAYLFSFK